jgi:hypothetical protein
MSARLPAALCAIALGLGAVLVYQLVAPVPVVTGPPDAVAVPVPQTLAVSTYAPPPAGQFAVINARPAFDPQRRAVAEPEELGATPDAPPDLTLVGVAISGRGAVALMKKDDGPAVSIALGQSIDGWQVETIARDGVTLHAGLREFTVKMREAKGLPQPALTKDPASAVTDQAGH